MQAFLTDIQSGEFEPTQDGLLLAPPVCSSGQLQYAERFLSGVPEDDGFALSEGRMRAKLLFCRKEPSELIMSLLESRVTALGEAGDRAARGCFPAC